MGLLKEITTTINADKELLEDFNLYLAECEANRVEKKFTILTEMEPPHFRSSAAETNVARDLQIGHDEQRAQQSSQAPAFIIVRKKDGTYTGTHPQKVEWNAAGTKSAKFASKNGDVWFDPDSKRKPSPEEAEKLSQKSPQLANADVYDQMT